MSGSGVTSASGLVDRIVVLTPRSWLARVFCDGQDFSGKRDGILVESDYFADGWRVVAPCEWIRDGFGGCSRGDCGWMVAWLGIVFGTRQFRKYWIDTVSQVSQQQIYIMIFHLLMSLLRGLM